MLEQIYSILKHTQLIMKEVTLRRVGLNPGQISMFICFAEKYKLIVFCIISKHIQEAPPPFLL